MRVYLINIRCDTEAKWGHLHRKLVQQASDLPTITRQKFSFPRSELRSRNMLETSITLKLCRSRATEKIHATAFCHCNYQLLNESAKYDSVEILPRLDMSIAFGLKRSYRISKTHCPLTKSQLHSCSRAIQPFSMNEQRGVFYLVMSTTHWYSHSTVQRDPETSLLPSPFQYSVSITDRLNSRNCIPLYICCSWNMFVTY